MNWCKNEYLYKKANKDQLSKMGKASQRIQELRRLNSEPVLYHPIGNPFCGMIYSLNLQYERPIEQTILLFDSDNRTSYRAMVDNTRMNSRGGWYDWHQYNAKAMQQRFICE